MYIVLLNSCNEFIYPLDPHGVKKWGIWPSQLLWMRRPCLHVRKTFVAGLLCLRLWYPYVGFSRVINSLLTYLFTRCMHLPAGMRRWNFTPKFDYGLSRSHHFEPHWLDIRSRSVWVTSRSGAIVPGGSVYGVITANSHFNRCHGKRHIVPFSSFSILRGMRNAPFAKCTAF